MDYTSYAATHPRNALGMYRNRSQSPPAIELVNEGDFDELPVAAGFESQVGDAEQGLESQRTAKADGFTGWGSSLVRDAEEHAAAALADHERATLYLKLGAVGSDTFELFDRMSALGEPGT